MSDDPYAERHRLTFEQAECADLLPAQLKTKELSKQLRSRIWLVLFEELERNKANTGMGGPSFIREELNQVIYDYFTLNLNIFADEYKNHFSKIVEKLKIVVSDGSYLEVFGLVQFIIRHRRCTLSLVKKFEWALAEGRAAYRIIEQKTIVPISSESEIATLENVFRDLRRSEFGGARQHLHNSATNITEGNYPASIRESIHAVESVARTLAPSGLLNDALSKLEKTTAIHGALKKGFVNIYGYTSDEQGIRHALLDDQSKVDEADALFMIGACSAFVSYMINKANAADLSRLIK